MIKEKKNKNLIQNDMFNAKIKFIYPDLSKRIIPIVRVNEKEYKSKIYLFGSIKSNHTSMVHINDKRIQK